MSAWKYTDASRRVASRTNADGSTESVLAEVLPQGTDILPPDPPPDRSPAERIADLERQAGMVKAVRKFMLTAMEAEAIKQGAAQGLTSVQALALLRSKNAGYAGVKALDEQIEALEALL